MRCFCILLQKPGGKYAGQIKDFFSTVKLAKIQPWIVRKAFSNCHFQRRYLRSAKTFATANHSKNERRRFLWHSHEILHIVLLFLNAYDKKSSTMKFHVNNQTIK